MSDDPRLYRRTFAVLSVVVGAGPLAVDSSLPAVRDMAEGLGTDMGSVQATLGAFVAGVAAGQLVFGAMSDRFGRRPTLILGLTAYVGAALAIAFAHSIEPVVILRFIQGMGSAACFIVSRAVVRDQFDVATTARLLASLFQVVSIYPVVCPIVAGELTQMFGWRAVYLFIAAVGGVGLLVNVAYLRETLAERDRDALRVRRIAAAFVELFRDAAFRGYLAAGLGAFIGLMILITAMPAVVVGHLGGTPADVGYLYAIVMAIHLAAAALGSRLIRRLGVARMIATGVSIVGLAAVATVIVAAADWVTPTSVVAVNALLMVGFAFTSPSMTAGALSNFHHMAGRATAVLGFVQQATGALTVFLIGITIDGTPRPHAIGMAVAGTLAFGAWFFLVRPLKHRTA